MPRVGSMYTVERTLADGTKRKYRYRRKAPKKADLNGTVYAALLAWRSSKQFKGLRPSTQAIYWRGVEPLEPMHPGQLAELRRRDLLGIVDALWDRPGICRQFIGSTQAWLTWCLDRELIEAHPFLRVERPALGKFDAWSPADRAYVLEHAPEWLRRAFLLSLGTGQRIADVMRMTWAQYDGNRIRLTQQKTLQPVVVPLTAELRAELDAWKREAVTVTILASPWGQPWRVNTFQQHWARWRDGQGLPRLTWHGLRSNALHALLEAGATTWEAASVTGHKSLKMVEDYARDMAREGLAEAAVLKLENAKRTK